MKSKKEIFIPLITLVIILGLIALLCVLLIPILGDIFENRDGRSAIEIIHAHGARGIPLLACLSALQVVTTVVPAALIQIPAGIVFGPWTGLVVCLCGAVIGNMIVFVALRQFHTALDRIFPKRKKKRKEKFQNRQLDSLKDKLAFIISAESINRMPHPAMIALLVYLIPVIPNGVLPHIFAHTKVSFGRYLLAVVAGNAPSTLVCTLIGDKIASGDYQLAIIIILIFCASVTTLFFLRRKIFSKISGGQIPDNEETTPPDAGGVTDFSATIDSSDTTGSPVPSNTPAELNEKSTDS